MDQAHPAAPTAAPAAISHTGLIFVNTDCATVAATSAQADTFPQCWPALRKVFGDVRPAAMMISAGLADPRMKIEIEVTARKRSA